MVRKPSFNTFLVQDKEGSVVIYQIQFMATPRCLQLTVYDYWENETSERAILVEFALNRIMRDTYW